jgi:internalin A
LTNLNNLQNLNFSGNYFSDISSLRNLTNLQKLGFSSNQVSDISPLTNLNNLQNLDFSSNQVSDISPLTNLNNVQYLDFRSNQVRDISPLTNLNNLQKLDFRSNQVSDISPLTNLNNLQTLNFRSNQVSDISPLTNLNNLQKLDFSSNQVSDISPLTNLNNLQYLYFSSNQVSDISPLTNLNNLQKLDFSENQVSDISFAFLQSFPRLDILGIDGNTLTKIPTEISNQWDCFGSLTAYFHDLKKGSLPNNEVKIVLIGNGSVGKTQVATRLQEQENYVFAEDHDSTHAIKLLRRELACDFLPSPLQLNIWDFGGQDIYHATHQLFLQTRALFLLVWDKENETNPSHLWEGTAYKNEKLDYWLKYSEYFSQKSPVLVIQNKVDSEQEADAIALPQITQNAFKKRFPHIVDFIQLSAKTGYAFELLEYLLQESFEENEQFRNDLINKPLPAPWVRLRNKIRVEQAKPDGLKMLSKETFQIWCEAELIPASTETLLYFFHESGVFYYNRWYFSGHIILDQTWAIAAVYKVLDKGKPYYKLLKQHKGKLTYKDICRIWKENTDAERALFLDFMLSCELSFETTENKEDDTPLNERTFVVPQLLSEQKPPYVEEYAVARGLAQQKAQEYLFLPPSLIQRFIIKAHAFAEIADMWQNGILLQYGNAAVVVEAVYGVEAHIVTRYNAAAEQEFLAVIWEELEKLEKGENCMSSEHYRKGESEFDARKFGFARLSAKNIPSSNEIRKEEIEIHLKKGEIKQAIALFSLYAQKYEPDLQHEIIQLSARFEVNENKRIKGIISEAEYSLEWNKVNDALVALL